MALRNIIASARVVKEMEEWWRVVVNGLVADVGRLRSEMKFVGSATNRPEIFASIEIELVVQLVCLSAKQRKERGTVKIVGNGGARHFEGGGEHVHRSDNRVGGLVGFGRV